MVVMRAVSLAGTEREDRMRGVGVGGLYR
jgi:hypothetical protein